MALQNLQDRLGYTFGDSRLLLQALTHVSYGHEYQSDLPYSRRDNERLEFLGDAVLDVVISDLLLENFPDSSEGQLTKIRAAIVNEKCLTEVAIGLGLQRHLRLGKGEQKSGGANKSSILSSTFEALVAAIYIDGGFQAVYPVIRHLFTPMFVDIIPKLSEMDFKTRLQEEVQAKVRITPTYHLISSTGPDHCRVFSVEVKMNDKVLALGQGFSKKEAEQAAAREALIVFNQYSQEDSQEEVR